MSPSPEPEPQPQPTTRALDRAEHVELNDRESWRRWLAANHERPAGIWLVTRRSPPETGLTYDASVEEALCFGWIDGQAKGVDDDRVKMYFSPRRAGSPWSASNKERIERLERAGRLAPAGLAVVERAKADGSWASLDSANRLELPDELVAALDARPPARANWDAFSPSVRRTILSWISLAKRDETRARRIDKTAEAAERNERAFG